MKNLTIVDSSLSISQTHPQDLTFKEKLEIVRSLTNIKVPVIELGKIINTRTDVLLIKTICAFAKTSCLSVDVGDSLESLELAWSAISNATCPRLKVSMPISPVQMEYFAHKKEGKMLEHIKEMVEKAVSLCPNTEFFAVDASRAEDAFLKSVVEIVATAGASVITLCDDAGKMMPSAYVAFVEKAKGFIPEGSNLKIGVYCDNKSGLALASTVMALSAGADEVKVMATGTEIPSLKDFAAIMENSGKDLGIEANLKYTELKRTIKQISWIVNKTQDKFDQDEDEAESRSHNMEYSQEDDLVTIIEAVKKMGYDLSDEDNGKVYEEFCRSAKKKTISTRELEAIVANVAHQVPPSYKLISYVINSGNIITAMAQIKVDYLGKEISGISSGDGPIDAAFLAIEQITGHHYELDDFQIQAVTEGREAMGSALVKIRHNGKLYSGTGISTDIIGAAIRAYVSALNKITYEEN